MKSIVRHLGSLSLTKNVIVKTKNVANENKKLRRFFRYRKKQTPLSKVRKNRFGALVAILSILAVITLVKLAA